MREIAGAARIFNASAPVAGARRLEAGDAGDQCPARLQSAAIHDAAPSTVAHQPHPVRRSAGRVVIDRRIWPVDMTARACVRWQNKVSVRRLPPVDRCAGRREEGCRHDQGPFRRGGGRLPRARHPFSDPRAPDAEADALAARFHASPEPIKGRINQKPHLLFPWLNAAGPPSRASSTRSRTCSAPTCSAGARSSSPRTRGDPSYVSWHQDAHLLGPVVARRRHRLGRVHAVTAENGCMRVVPGTHSTPGAARRHLRRDQPALARPGDRGRGRRERRPST